MKWKRIFGVAGLLMSAGIWWVPVPLISTSVAVAQQSPQEMSWPGLFDWFRRRKTRAGSRGDVLGLAPAPVSDNIARVWNTKPVFIWRGTAVAIEVRRLSDYKVIWASKLKSGDQWVPYRGEPLVAGERYVWRLLNGLSETPTILSSQSFQVMSLAERVEVQSELTQLAENLEEEKMKQVLPEILALHRSLYFSQKGMAADALKEVLLFNNPSEELRQLIPTMDDLPEQQNFLSEQLVANPCQSE